MLKYKARLKILKRRHYDNSHNDFTYNKFTYNITKRNITYMFLFTIINKIIYW